jgi:hypothetical protein
MTIAFVSNDEFRAATPGLDLSQYTETTLSGVLLRATARAERFLEYSLPFESISSEKAEGEITSLGELIVFPRKYPVRTVSAVSIVKGSFSSALTLDNYDIPSRADEIVFSTADIELQNFSVIDFDQLRNEDFYVVISYTAGYYMYDRPQDLIDAIILMARDEVARNLNPGGASEIKQGAVTIKYKDKTDIQDGKSDLVRDAEAILQTYKRVSGW